MHMLAKDAGEKLQALVTRKHKSINIQLFFRHFTNLQCFVTGVNTLSWIAYAAYAYPTLAHAYALV